jgi:hypothetical protein
MKEALKLALEALEEAHYKIEHKQNAAKREQAITAIKEALAQLAQEPFTYYDPVRDAIRPFPVDGDIPLYTTPSLPVQPAQEPVAIYRAGQAKGEVFHVEFLKEMGADEVLLYTAPPAAQPPLPAQEPDELTIAYMSGLYDGKKKRAWAGLTNDELLHIGVATGLERAAAHMIEQALKGKNT